MAIKFPAEAIMLVLSLRHRVQTGSGAHLASYPMGIEASFPEGKAAGSWMWPLTSI
jgi:hypothetical protein